MNAIEIIALIIILGGAIKMLVLLVNPKSYFNFAKSFWSSPGLMKIVGLVLGAIILYYLNAAGITIIEILAVTAFVSSLLIIGLASEVEPLLKRYEARIKKGTLWKEFWLYSLIWVILLVWGAKVLFT